MRLSIIVPVCDEGERISATLDPLVELRHLGVEVIAVDGGSRDATIQRARLRVDKVLSAPRGRASQVNAGAEKASGDVLLCLDPGTRLPPAAEHLVLDGLVRSGRAWGRFNVRIEGRDLLLPAVSFCINRWSCLGGIAAFEQAIFVKRDVPQCRRLSAWADGGCRILQRPQAREPAALHRKARTPAGPVLGNKRGSANRF